MRCCATCSAGTSTPTCARWPTACWPRRRLPDRVAARLAQAGFVAAEEEAAELRARAGGEAALLEQLLARRLTGEPLAWITGSLTFCGLTLRVDPGVYVPRWHTEMLARRAVKRLPEDGTAFDVCTGAGAIAATLAARRPHATVLATEVDPRAVACARANGVDVLEGDLFDPLPPGVQADVLTAVVPYVPTGELGLLQRDTFTFESTLAYDGGLDGADVLRRVVAGAPRVLKPGGTLLLELGAGQPELLGLGGYAVLVDEDGDVRGVEATF